jgi:zinc protease
VIGYEEDLTKMTAQDARDFYERFYSPDRATIVVVGDVDEERLYRRIDRLYGNFAAKRTPDGDIRSEPAQTAQKRRKLELNVEVEKLWLAFKMPSQSAPEAPVFEAIQGLLSEGKNGRLNRALVDSGVASSVGTGALTLRDPGLFLIEVDLQKGKSALLAESIIMRELDRLKSSPVKEEELKRALNVMRFKFLEKLSSTNGKAHYIGQMETDLGSLESGLQFQKKIMETTPEQIQQISGTFFDTSRLTVITAIPKAKTAATSAKGAH